MSTTPSALSAGLQVLSKAGLLPDNLTTQQLDSLPAGDATKIAIGSIQATAIASLFGGTAPSGDSVNLSDNVTAALLGQSTASDSTGTDPILQALETTVANASNAALGSGTAGASSSSLAVSLAANSATAQVGSLFSYLG